MYLRLKNIRKKLGSFQLNIDCAIREGEFVTFLGPSGCGKTTVLNIISGIVTPDSGSVFLSGRDITRTVVQDRGVGMVFQDYALFPHLPVGKNVGYGPKSRNLDREETVRRVEQYLSLVGLPGTEKRRIGSLSGGEKQRIALARALASHPKILLLDEPLSALDTKLRQRLRKEIHRVHKETGITTVYVTHDQEEALTLSDRIFLLKEGMLVQHGTPEQLYRKPINAFTASFLGEANLVPCRSVEQKAGGISAEIEGAGTLFCKADLHGPGGRIAFFRPEDCTVSFDESGWGPNWFKGKVTLWEYRGASSLLQVAAGSIRVSLLLHGPGKKAREGDTVWFRIAPEDVLLLKEDD